MAASATSALLARGLLLVNHLASPGAVHAAHCICLLALLSILTRLDQALLRVIAYFANSLLPLWRGLDM